MFSQIDEATPFKQIHSASDETVEEILQLVRNQEKDVNEDVMYENIVLKKAFLKPLDVPLPSIPSNSVYSMRKKSSSCPETSSSWPKTRRRADSEFFLDNSSHENFLFDKSVLERRRRTISLPPLTCDKCHATPSSSTTEKS